MSGNHSLYNRYGWHIWFLYNEFASNEINNNCKLEDMFFENAKMTIAYTRNCR